MTASYRFDQTAAGANDVLSLDANGFTVGNGNNVNQNTIAYHYVAWNATPGQVSVGSYTGNGVDNRDDHDARDSHPSGPSCVGRRTGTTRATAPSHRTSDVPGDITLNFTNTAGVRRRHPGVAADGVPGGHQLSGEHEPVDVLLHRVQRLLRTQRRARERRHAEAGAHLGTAQRRQALRGLAALRHQ